MTVSSWDIWAGQEFYPLVSGGFMTSTSGNRGGWAFRGRHRVRARRRVVRGERISKICPGVLVRPVCRFQQGLQGGDGHAQRSSGESVHVGGVDSDHFASRIEYRTTAAAVSRGCVIDELVADDVAQMAAGRRRADQREG